MRSTWLFTTPSSVTRPRSTMMWIGGFTIEAYGRKFGLRVDRPRDAEAKLVVELRHRQHLDVVVELRRPTPASRTRCSMSFFLYGIVTLPTSVTVPLSTLRADAVEDREMRILQHLPLHITEHLQVFWLPGGAC